jgi:enoyl-[acyl-carrier protein] reductase I
MEVIMLSNKNIVVMGVANKWSIAWAIAKVLKDNNANLIFTYSLDRSGESLKRLVSEENMEVMDILQCNVTVDEDVEKVFSLIGEKYGKIHGVVHSIAHAKKEELVGRYVDTSREGYLLAQNISSYSLVKVSKEASKIMNSNGSIVTISYLGGEKVVKHYNVMGVAKAALDMSVRYLANDLGKDGIRVNAISSGPIKTLAAKGVSGFNEILTVVEEKSPLRRCVSPNEVGNTALFLLSDLSTAITGELIHVDCGFSIMGY